LAAPPVVNDRVGDDDRHLLRPDASAVERRDALLALAAAQVAERGEAAVLYP
jgi:hypothetical protein